MQNTPNVQEVILKLLHTMRAAADEAIQTLETNDGFVPGAVSEPFVKTGERGKVSFINETPTDDPMATFQANPPSAATSFTSEMRPSSTPSMVEDKGIEFNPPAEEPMPSSFGMPQQDEAAKLNDMPQTSFEPPVAAPQTHEEPQMTRQEFEKLYTDAWGKIWAESGGNLDKAKKTLAEWIAPYKASQPHLFDDAGKTAAASKKVA